MNLPDTIYAHVRALPVDLQREALHFIVYLEQQHRRPTIKTTLTTDAFLDRFAGSIGADFPDDINNDLPTDPARESLE